MITNMDRSAVYITQCKTFKVAQELANDHRTVTTGNVSHNAPFCLRLVPAHRDDYARSFRDMVAAETRRRRSGGLI